MPRAPSQRAGGTDRVGLDDGVDQQVAGSPLELGLGKLSFDQETAAGLDRPRAGEPGLDGLDGQPLAERSDARGRFDQDVPEHGH